ALCRVEPWRRCWRTGLAWWTLTSAMLDWHLGMFETDGGTPRELGAADALTLTRAWLVPLAAEDPTLTICGFAAVTDLLDGPLARRSAPTRAGRDLEGLVDVCFTLAALRGARRQQLLGTISVSAEAARLITGVACSALVYLGRAQPPRPALLRAARATTVLRATGLITAVAGKRRAGDVLLSIGSAASVALIVRSLVHHAALQARTINSESPCGSAVPAEPGNTPGAEREALGASRRGQVASRSGLSRDRQRRCG
ncbi:MAG: hypothetical protein LC720_02775, partial [Actinobacteria bacterium]|nr:hypothetical protein [Actinomycetota bacterium]